MNSQKLTYIIPGASWTLEISHQTLETFRAHVQTGRNSKESVGQLYARDLTKNRIEIEFATVLRPTWATFSKVKIDKNNASAERDAMFKKGFHCIGTWHTHPEKIPKPSGEDLAFGKDHTIAAKSQLTGVVFIIVGTHPFPQGLTIWAHDGNSTVTFEIYKTSNSLK